MLNVGKLKVFKEMGDSCAKMEQKGGILILSGREASVFCRKSMGRRVGFLFGKEGERIQTVLNRKRKEEK